MNPDEPVKVTLISGTILNWDAIAQLFPQVRKLDASNIKTGNSRAFLAILGLLENPEWSPNQAILQSSKNHMMFGFGIEAHNETLQSVLAVMGGLRSEDKAIISASLGQWQQSLPQLCRSEKTRCVGTLILHTFDRLGLNMWTAYRRVSRDGIILELKDA